MEYLYKKIANGVITKKDLMDYFNYMLNSDIKINEKKFKLSFDKKDSITSYDANSKTYTIDLEKIIIKDLSILNDRVKYNLLLIKIINDIIAYCENEKLLDSDYLYNTDPELFVCVANERINEKQNHNLSRHISELKSDFYTLKMLEGALAYGLDTRLYFDFIHSSNSKILSYVEKERKQKYSLLERSILLTNTPDSIVFSINKFNDTKSDLEENYSSSTAHNYERAMNNMIDRKYIRLSDTLLSKLSSLSFKDMSDEYEKLNDYSLANKLLYGKRLDNDEIDELYDASHDMSILDYVVIREKNRRNKKITI